RRAADLPTGSRLPQPRSSPRPRHALLRADHHLATSRTTQDPHRMIHTYAGRATNSHSPQALRGRVGQGGDEVSVAAFIASQRTEHGVPHAVACRALGVSQSWFYTWRDRPPTPRQRRRAELAEAIRVAFDASGGTYGSPRITL